MNLTETYTKPLKEILEGCNITEQKIHTDEDGTICSIELKYVPKDNDETQGKQKTKKSPF